MNAADLYREMRGDDLQRENIAKALVTAGLSPVVAPTAARDALARIAAGEGGAVAVRAVAADWSAAAPSLPAKPVPTPPAEPQRRVLATVNGCLPLKARAR